MSDDTGEAARMDRKHIFVVNGSPMFLDLMRMVLQDEHYNVTTTNFVPRTFEQIIGLQPDLLIVDLAVKEMAGWTLLERLKQEAQTHEIPVIVVSTTPGHLEKAEAESERYSGQLYVAKPFNLDDILDGVRSLIGGARRTEDNAVPASP
ncbi:MAG TPA: response regulator [Thermomicrobiales bacterium]|nr:response regulator [Thermomicrobiales bacterium]